MSNQDKGRPSPRAIVGFAVYLLLGPIILFIAAGTLKWPWAWAYVLLGWVATFGSRLLVWRISPDTLRERGRFGEVEAPSWDRLLGPIVGMLGPLVIGLVAGLDHRFGWSRVPASVQWAAALALVAAYAFATWALAANRYFSAVARIQSDRGQTVVSSGPYALVRHPAYASSLVGSVAMALMLGSLAGLIPAAGMIAALIARTKLEDEMLQAGLPGYADYAARVRYRLIPGVW